MVWDKPTRVSNESGLPLCPGPGVTSPHCPSAPSLPLAGVPRFPLLFLISLHQANIIT